MTAVDQQPRTTLPARQATSRLRVPRQLTMIRLRDVMAVVGSLFAAMATTLLLWQQISPFSGVIGFGIVAWVLFICYYALLVSFDEDRPALRDRVSAMVVLSLGAVVLAALAWIIVYTVLRGWPALIHLNFFSQDGYGSGGASSNGVVPLTQSGALHAIVGTLIELAIALAASVPLGLLTAVFINEVPGAYSRFVRIVVDAMTAMPDVLAGLFIYATLILTFGFPKSGLCAGLALGITAMPIVCRASDVVLRLMPGGLTEASYALGSGQWRTIWYVTLPTVRSGLATAVILGAARAVGETAPVLLVAGSTNALSVNPKSGPMMSLPLMAYTDVFLTPSPVDIERGFGAAVLLLVLVVVLFLIARRVGGRGPGVLSPAQQRRRVAASRRDVVRYARYAHRAQAAQSMNQAGRSPMAGE
jgi:phosphate transport system permease protein